MCVCVLYCPPRAPLVAAAGLRAAGAAQTRRDLRSRVRAARASTPIARRRSHRATNRAIAIAVRRPPSLLPPPPCASTSPVPACSRCSRIHGATVASVGKECRKRSRRSRGCGSRATPRSSCRWVTEAPHPSIQSAHTAANPRSLCATRTRTPNAENAARIPRRARPAALARLPSGRQRRPDGSGSADSLFETRALAQAQALASAKAALNKQQQRVRRWHGSARPSPAVCGGRCAMRGACRPKRPRGESTRLTRRCEGRPLRRRRSTVLRRRSKARYDSTRFEFDSTRLGPLHAGDTGRLGGRPEGPAVLRWAHRDRARCMRRCHAWRGWSGVSHSR